MSLNRLQFISFGVIMKSELISRPLLRHKSSFVDPSDLQNMYLAENFISAKKSIDKELDERQ